MSGEIRSSVSRRWDEDEQAWEVSASMPGSTSQKITFFAADAAEALVEAQHKIARQIGVARDAVVAEWDDEVSHLDARTFGA